MAQGLNGGGRLTFVPKFNQVVFGVMTISPKLLACSSRRWSWVERKASRTATLKLRAEVKPSIDEAIKILNIRRHLLIVHLVTGKLSYRGIRRSIAYPSCSVVHPPCSIICPSFLLAGLVGCRNGRPTPG